MLADREKEREYVRSIDLSDTPRGIVAQGAGEEAQEVFDAAKDQAQVVGSGLLSFAHGVTPEVRAAISDSALLAQLVANKRASADKDPTAWYAEYSQVLQNIGWVVQDHGWADYTAEGKAAEVHEKIIEVLSVALGPSVTALRLIQSAIDVLKNMKPDTSWLTIFSRETQHARIARFQVGLVEPGEADEIFVTMLACLIEGEKSITQVLFFKYRAERARFLGNSAKASINLGAIEELGPEIRKKVRAYMTDYVSGITDL
ncbi:hypothetical protein ACQPZJ_16490 [Actinoplanes sp. CA-054009]